jgi:predicted AlkP superfamily pyrophosphatase or phosphodiesterase
MLRAFPSSFRCLLALAWLPVCALAHGPGKGNDFGGRRVLLIGIDGCRADALKKTVADGRAPNLAGLIAAGTVTWNAYTGGEPGGATQQQTSSGPGWTTVLTGVWRDQHGVADNRFRFHRIPENPHVFRRIKDACPTAWLASFCDWPEIHRSIVGASERPGQAFLDCHHTRVPDPRRRGTDYAEFDAELTAIAAEKIRRENPDAVFMYFGNVDETGHGAADKDGRFSPDNEPYLAAIAQVDKYIGELLAALHARPRFAEEDWLILATTDHGGAGKTHGEQSAEERTIWMLASGGRAPRGKVIETATPQTAVAPTVLRHLDLPVPANWTAPFALPAK